MHRIERVFWIGVLALCFAHSGPAQATDETWRKDPVPEIQRMWDQVTKARLEEARLVKEVARQLYLSNPPSFRRQEAEAELLELQTSIANARKQVEAHRKRRLALEAARKAKGEGK